jgi:hypothetical protein
VNYHQKKWLPQAEGLWADVFRAQRFIMDHRGIFDTKWESGARVAILYIENEGMRYRTRSYMGISLALAESNIPYDVIVDGGDGYVPVTLTEDKLTRYQLVIVPQALGLAQSQKDALAAYLAGCGAVLTPDTNALPANTKLIALPQAEVPSRGSCDLGAVYYYGYDDAVRHRIADIVSAHSDRMLDVSGADRTVSVYPHIQTDKKRVVLHVVNSDYDKDTNRMRPKEGLSIRLKKPDYYEAAREAHVYSPDLPYDDKGQSYAIAPAVREGFIELVIPRLDVYSIVVL